MSVPNRLVALVLESPLHRVLSGTTDLIRYRGHRSGRTFTTPTQYAWDGDDIVILVGRPETKSWWRNFRDDRDIDVLVRGEWLAMTARAVTGQDEPEQVAHLLEVYLARFPRAARQFSEETAQQQVARAVVVRCHSDRDGAASR